MTIEELKRIGSKTVRQCVRTAMQVAHDNDMTTHERSVFFNAVVNGTSVMLMTAAEQENVNE